MFWGLIVNAGVSIPVHKYERAQVEFVVDKKLKEVEIESKNKEKWYKYIVHLPKVEDIESVKYYGDEKALKRLAKETLEKGLSDEELGNLIYWLN